MIDNFDATTEPRASGLLKRTSAALALSLGMLGMAGGDVAFAGGPFAGMDGSWAGSGTVAMDSGTKERMRCTAQYLVKDDDNNLQQHLNCSSPSYDFKVNTYVDHAGGSLSGYWEELKNNVRGSVDGNTRGNRVHVVLQGSAFSAVLDLVTSGTKPVGDDHARPRHQHAGPARRHHAAPERLTQPARVRALSDGPPARQPPGPIFLAA